MESAETISLEKTNAAEHIFDQSVENHLFDKMLSMGRWGLLLSILGIIIILVLTFIGLSEVVRGRASSEFLWAGLLTYPVICLMQYHSVIRTAHSESSMPHLNKAAGYLRNLFRYLGLLAIALIICAAVFLLIIISTPDFHR